MNPIVTNIITFLIFTMSKGMSTKINDLVIFDQFAALSDALMYILENCGGKHNTIVIISKDRSFVKLFSTMPRLTSIFLDDNFEVIKKPDQLKKKADAVIMDKQSVNTFENYIYKNAPWWNVETPCFVFDTKNFFNQATDEVWDTSPRISASIPLMMYFFTVDVDNEVFLFRINGILMLMPPMRHLMLAGRIVNKNKFDKRTVCENLYYDDFKYRNKIMTITSQEISKFGLSEKAVDSYELHSAALRVELNSSVEFLMYPLPVTDQSMNHKYNWEGAYYNVNLFIMDFTTFDSLLYEVTFPFRFHQLNFLVHHQGYKTPFEKIRDYYGIWICLSLILILCITFIVLKLKNNKKGLAFIIFEILRFLINTSIVTPLKFSSLRIFMSVIFLYFLILHATFSGRLVEFLTKLESRKNAETLEDLKDPQYKLIFYPHFLSEYIKDVGLDHKAFPYDDISNCMSEIALSKSVVCIGEESNLISHSASSKYRIKGTLHKPQNNFGSYYTPGLARRDKQMRSKINKAFLRVLESGIDNFLRNKDKMKIINSQKRKSAREGHNFVPINVKILASAFIMLSVGLVCATLSFIFEIVKN